MEMSKVVFNQKASDICRGLSATDKEQLKESVVPRIGGKQKRSGNFQENEHHGNTCCCYFEL